MPRRKGDRKRPEAADVLTPSQYVAIAALVAGDSNEAAAAKAKVGLRTLYRWRYDNKAFAREYQQRASSVVDVVERRLKAAGVRAVDALVRMLADPDDDAGVKREPVPYAVQVAASREVLSRIAPERSAVEHSGSVQVDADERLAAAFRALGTLPADERAKLRGGDG